VSFHRRRSKGERVGIVLIEAGGAARCRRARAALPQHRMVACGRSSARRAGQRRSRSIWRSLTTMSRERPCGDGSRARSWAALVETPRGPRHHQCAQAQNPPGQGTPGQASAGHAQAGPRAADRPRAARAGQRGRRRGALFDDQRPAHQGPARSPLAATPSCWPPFTPSALGPATAAAPRVARGPDGQAWVGRALSWWACARPVATPTITSWAGDLAVLRADGAWLLSDLRSERSSRSGPAHGLDSDRLTGGEQPATDPHGWCCIAVLPPRTAVRVRRISTGRFAH